MVELATWSGTSVGATCIEIVAGPTAKKQLMRRLTPTWLNLPLRLPPSLGLRTQNLNGGGGDEYLYTLLVAPK